MKNTKRLIYNFEARCVEIISEGLLSGLGKRPILRTLKKELARFEFSDTEVSRLWIMCVELYNRIARLVKSKRTDKEVVYQAIKKTFPVLDKTCNGLVKDIEERNKREYLHGLLSTGIFYLCSYHEDCAKDHVDYQGKIYVSTDWESRCTDKDTRYKIRSYIKNHNCMTVEEVCDSPVYMIRRPNCRHFFIRVSVEEVLHGSVKKLLVSHKMVRKKRRSNAADKRRLRLLKKLKRICPCDKLDKDIKRIRKRLAHD